MLEMRQEAATTGVTLSQVARERTLADVAVTNLVVVHGMPKWKANIEAARALTTIWRMAKAAKHFGRWPTQNEFAEYWETKPRSAQREWERFRKAFPSERSPRRLAEQVYARTLGDVEENSTIVFTVEADEVTTAALPV